MPPVNDPIYFSSSSRSFRHLELQNPSIIFLGSDICQKITKCITFAASIKTITTYVGYITLYEKDFFLIYLLKKGDAFGEFLTYFRTKKISEWILEFKVSKSLA